MRVENTCTLAISDSMTVEGALDTHHTYSKCIYHSRGSCIEHERACGVANMTSEQVGVQEHHRHTDVLCTRKLAGGNTRGKRTELHSCRCSRSRGSASCRFFRQHRMLCHGSWTGLHSAVVSLELHLLCPNTLSARPRYKFAQAWLASTLER